MKKDVFTARWNFILIAAIGLQACGTAAIAATSTPAATNTPPATATNTPRPTATTPPSATPNLAATQQYESFTKRIQEFAEKKYIPSTKGTYRRLDDYSTTYAKAGYYQWQTVVDVVTEFVIRTDVSMETVKQSFERGGCGFVVHGSHMLMLSQKGNAYRYAPYVGIGPANYIGGSKNPWNVELTLIYSGGVAWLLVDDKMVLTANGLEHTNDNLALAVISGSNEGYGTRCEFKNIDFWNIQE